MLSTSSSFKYLLNKYSKSDVADAILKEINRFELEIETNKIQLSKINKSNYNLMLETSLTHIDYADKLLAWCNQLKIKVKTKKHLCEKSLDRETIIINKEIEDMQEIALITSKTEKTAMKNKLLKEKLLSLQENYDEVKLDYDVSETFVNEVSNYRESRYAYYQAVKNIQLEF